MLFYVSIGLIFLGLGFLLYYLLSVSLEKKTEIEEGSPPEEVPLADQAGKRPAEPEVFSRADSVSLDEEYPDRRIPPVPEQVPPQVVPGVLFLSAGKRLPLLAHRGTGGRPGLEDDPREFNNLKRVGEGSMILDKDSFLIRVGNASYSYSASELDMILFQKKGVALMPLAENRPVPVFITPEPDIIKSYIKKNRLLP